MTAAIAAPLITIIGTILLAAATYWFTKARERDADIRKEKLEHYKNFTIALSGIISDEGTDDGQRAFSKACNNLNLIASQHVLIALQQFQDEIRISNLNKDRTRHDILLSELYYHIRRDLHVSPKDKEETFRIGIWASGVVASRSDLQVTEANDRARD